MAKTILITGASTGIGAETARFLAEWNLILVHYNASKSAAEKVAGDVVRLGGEARLFQADLTSEDGCSELAPRIRVNAVAPGVIKTPFHERYSSEERMKAFAENSVLKRNGEAHHIAMAIKLIVENDFITGETLDINGGLFMR